MARAAAQMPSGIPAARWSAPIAAESAGGCAVALEDRDDAATALASILHEGDVLLTLGAGDVDRVAHGWIAGGGAA